MASIKCGNCKGTHENVAQVRACYGQPPVASTPLSAVLGDTTGDRQAERDAVATSTKGQPATKKQVAFAMRLQEERVDENDWIGETDYEAFTKGEISSAIDEMLAMPKRLATTGAFTKQRTEDPETGIYLDETNDGDVVYKVYKMVHGSGRQGVKRLDIDAVAKTGSFRYLGLAVRHLPASASKMSLEKAQEFGRIYGFCVKCGRTLTDEGSIAAGIGPVCAGKGW